MLSLSYTNTPAVLHAGAWLPGDNSLSTGTPVLEPRPWWLQSIVNRFSFFPKLLLCQTIMDSDEFPAVVSLCLGKKGEHDNSMGLKPGLQHEMQFQKRLDIDGPFCYHNGQRLLHPGRRQRPVWYNQTAEKVTFEWLKVVYRVWRG